MKPSHGRTAILSVAFGVFIVAPGAAQESIHLDKPVLVSRGHADEPHVEPFLAAQPTDPDRLLGAAITFPHPDAPGELNGSIVVGYRSDDAGRSWVRSEFPACRADPWVAFDDDLAFVTCLGQDQETLEVYSSPDGGTTWTQPTEITAGDGGGIDRPVVVVGPSSAEGVGPLYAAYGRPIPMDGLSRPRFGPSLSTSDDGGASFEEPVFVRHDNLEQQPFDATVLSDGTLALFFMDFASPEGLLEHRRTWLVRSDDRGRTLSVPLLVLEQRADEMPWSVAVDRSTLHRDRLYVVSDGFWKRRGTAPGSLPPDPGSGLFVIWSDDRGESWSRRVEVADPPPMTNQETPAIAVNGNGVVGVAWYDTRQDPKGECFDIYFAASVDGGETFLPDVRVTPTSSCPSAVPEQRMLATRWPFGGDYSGLAASPDGRFHLLWADSRDGVYQIWSATATVLPKGSNPSQSAATGP